MLKNWWLLKIRLVLVPHHVLEHGAVFHVMAVNDIVAAVEIALALKIQINRTRDILLAVKIMVQVKVVVRSLDDGIIDCWSLMVIQPTVSGFSAQSASKSMGDL